MRIEDLDPTSSVHRRHVRASVGMSFGQRTLWLLWPGVIWDICWKILDDYYKWILKELASWWFQTKIFVKLAHLAKITNIWKHPPRWRCYKILEPPIWNHQQGFKKLGPINWGCCVFKKIAERDSKTQNKKTYPQIYYQNFRDEFSSPQKKTKYVRWSNCGRISSFQVGIPCNLVKWRVLTMFGGTSSMRHS